MATLFRPGEVVFQGPDYDIVADVKPNGKLLCVLKWRRENGTVVAPVVKQKWTEHHAN